ncbi:MAG: hypothetical protein KIH10_14225 [Candidatus Freyarchaeota archaeon]|nr:hypothetical protein [Candidatus Jordarchaeia archaeon]MBS7279993.1 hypothetical protein [Candidatus Jordarchaeia archaeon]
MAADIPIDEMIKLIEINVGNWKPVAVAIIDKNFRIWGMRGNVPQKVLDLFANQSLEEIRPGDSIHYDNTFLMKVTEKTAAIVSMGDVRLSILASANLRGRINALSDFYRLEKFVDDFK